MSELPEQALELRSLVTPDGMLELSLQDVDIPAPAADEVVVRVEASSLCVHGDSPGAVAMARAVRAALAAAGVTVAPFVVPSP